MRPLNVGDVVSAGISLLRSHFKTFLGLSFKGVLWYLIPVYGWARGLMIFAQIARLGYQDIIHEPESVPASLRKVEPRLWSFLGVAILVAIIQFAVNYAISSVGGVLMAPFLAISAAGAAAAVLAGILIVVLQLAMLAAQIWIQARFWMYDIIIATEADIEPTSSISRSWELTKGSAGRVLLVLLVAYLVMAPLYLLTLVPFIITVPFFVTANWENPDPTIGFALLLAFLAFFVLVLLAAILSIPFWQAIKAVLYYDLRSRREGIDIQLSDRPRDRQQP
jgi:hypothetical protein